MVRTHVERPTRLLHCGIVDRLGMSCRLRAILVTAGRWTDAAKGNLAHRPDGSAARSDDLGNPAGRHLVSDLTDAILNGDIGRVRALIRDRPALMSEPGASGTLPLDLARNKGRVDAEVALAVAGAPGHRVRDARELLERMMSELSNDFACAGWLSELEYLLWASVVGDGPAVADRDACGLGALGPEASSDLGRLARAACGWYVWDASTSKATFLAMDEWIEEYSRWRRRPSAEAARP
jgi:hypothetical protein